MKRNHRSGADGLFAMSNTIVTMAERLAASSTAASKGLTSPEQMTTAIATVQADISDEEEILDAVGLFQRDPKLTMTYLALHKDLRSRWLTCEIKAAEATANLNFQMFPQ
jgi:hypothetical protein